jgi:hypothetical protein
MSRQTRKSERKGLGDLLIIEKEEVTIYIGWIYCA